MTEMQLQSLGFEREDYADFDGEHYYYSYDIAKGFGFISAGSDEVTNDEWFVEFFDSWPTIRFTDFEEVRDLIKLIESRIDESTR